MSPAEFYAATLREVDAVVRAYRWRQEEQYRALRYGAWHSALYQRVEARQFPSLQKAMGLSKRIARAQSGMEQKAMLLAWKASTTQGPRIGA